MKNIVIRQAVLADIEAHAQLFNGYRQFYRQASNIDAARAFLLERFNHSESIIFIAFNGAEPVGFSQLYPSFSSVSLARDYILNDLFVSESARKLGVGSKLLAASADYAKAFGAVRVTLTTAITNKTAQAVYEANGWKRDEVFFTYHFST